jgi:hypothetical protein
MALEDKININLNQNLWALVASYLALGAAEHWHLGHLLWLARIAATVTTWSLVATCAAYSWNYCKKKLWPVRKTNSQSKSGTPRGTQI